MMVNLAQSDAGTLTPYRRMYQMSETTLLSDDLFAPAGVPADATPPENAGAMTPQVIPLPSRAQFEDAVARWEQDIRFDSFPEDMKEHDSFGEIISQGYGVVPLIAAHLRKRPSFLFLALEEIFGEDPVPENAYGRLSSVTSAWLEWLRR